MNKCIDIVKTSKKNWKICETNFLKDKKFKRQVLSINTFDCQQGTTMSVTQTDGQTGKILKGNKRNLKHQFLLRHLLS